MRNMKIAAAVSGVLAACAAPSAFASYTGEPAAQTTAAAAPAANFFWLAGSSAAVSGFGTSVGADLCNTSASPIATFQTIPGKVPTAQNPGAPVPAVGTPDFRMFSCTASAALGTLAGQTINVAYRADGGSVVGAYGPLRNVAVNELDISTAWCSADATLNTYDCATALNTTQPVPAGALAITGTTTANGPSDSYGGALVPHKLFYGITDLEPGAFGNPALAPKLAWAGGGNNDPLVSTLSAPYPYTFLGADASPATLQAMPHTLLFQQTFGFVASTNLNITDISSADVAAILSGTITDWAKIPRTAADGAAGPVTAAKTKIIVCQRDLGSGTRTSADVIFTGDGCNTTGAALKNVDANANLDNFSTPDELACVNASTGNAIGYVSVDNFSKVVPGGSTYPNVHSLTLDGRTDNNGASAVGGIQYAVEASINQNVAYVPSANENIFFPRLIIDLQQIATAPQSAQVNTLPGHGTNASNGGTVQTNGKINMTSFVRDLNGLGNSCNSLNIQ
jgi:PBP superfamily domain